MSSLLFYPEHDDFRVIQINKQVFIPKGKVYYTNRKPAERFFGFHSKVIYRHRPTNLIKLYKQIKFDELWLMPSSYGKLRYYLNDIARLSTVCKIRSPQFKVYSDYTKNGISDEFHRNVEDGGFDDNEKSLTILSPPTQRLHNLLIDRYYDKFNRFYIHTMGDNNSDIFKYWNDFLLNLPYGLRDRIAIIRYRDFSPVTHLHYIYVPISEQYFSSFDYVAGLVGDSIFTGINTPQIMEYFKILSKFKEVIVLPTI